MGCTFHGHVFPDEDMKIKKTRIGNNVNIVISGHMTKMAAMPINDKNSSKIFFSRTGEPIYTKLSTKHL